MGVGCGPPPELVAERDSLKLEVERLSAVEQRLEKEVDGSHAKVRSLERQLAAAKQEVALARIGVAADDPLSVELQTSMGTIRCALHPGKAPITVANFVQLAEGSKTWTDPRTKEETQAPLYDGTIFHRVIPGFMVQGGDPLGNGRGGPGYRFEDETESGMRFDKPGLLAMANSGPDTNGSQFFITDRATPHHLDGKHTIFGECQNLDVVEAIASVATGAANRPEKDVVLRRVRILRGTAATL
ncbi:MAG TPA: peptidylprolyl isomerase [Deltaproteobacteria bacterium]|nr:peptidylprolyl isomerase [Deltaproteobacteria bacterium]